MFRVGTDGLIHNLALLGASVGRSSRRSAFFLSKNRTANQVAEQKRANKDKLLLTPSRVTLTAEFPAPTAQPAAPRHVTSLALQLPTQASHEKRKGRIVF